MCRSTTTSAITLERVTRTVRDERYLHELDAVLGPGLHTLLGPTLAGKTTLLRLIAGLDRPTTGTVRITGERSVAMVYQHFVNYPSLTVYENIASPLRVARAADIDRRVRTAAATLQIEDVLGRLPSELSGGQQQRTALARALVKEAGVVLLDEPLANLDYKLRDDLRSQIRGAFAERDSVLVYATSDPAEALTLGGDVLVLDEGRLLQTGGARDVYDAPGHERVARIMTETTLNLWPARVAGTEVAVPGAPRFPTPRHLAHLPSGDYRLGVRPHHVRVERSCETDVRLQATVDLAEITGSETLIHARLGDLELRSWQTGVHRMEQGAPVELFLEADQLIAFHPDGNAA